MNNVSKLLHAASYSARKHQDQRRKGSNAEPYINHPIEVANILANIGGVDDVEILIAALLHDTVEDVGVTPEELTELFGARVCGLVLEVTDDKSLPKERRKRLQVEHASHLTTDAKHIKLADKISNVTDVTNNPPDDWSEDRRREYINWAKEVVDQVRGTNPQLEKHFDNLFELATAKFGK